MICPFCGEMIPRSAACPHCGSDEHTGWNPSYESENELHMETDEHETRSQGLLNPKKHPFAAFGFFLLVAVIVLMFILRYVL